MKYLVLALIGLFVAVASPSASQTKSDEQGFSGNLDRLPNLSLWGQFGLRPAYSVLRQPRQGLIAGLKSGKFAA